VNPPLPPEHERTTGTRPTGTASDADAATAVQQMFDSAAPRYDLLNHLLSFGIDHWWWWRAARAFRAVLTRPEAVVLDLCCGTGEMTMALYKHRPQSPTDAPLLAIDFSHNMLARGARKFAPHNIVPIQGDALHLPLADSSIDLVTLAFGFRNLANYEAGLTELFRVLKPGGQIGILEFNQPQGIVGAVYLLYFTKLLPALGGLVSGERGAYEYLPESVARFPRPPRMKEMIRAAGFADAAWTGYTFGTAGLYRGIKPAR
jgi:demethylmenaquinone methyltransferase/2-methoxy-6-polyprenyl-1,4-benzoquinol methylase